jgi:transcriptional regulator with XRE-family HTH domain
MTGRTSGSQRKGRGKANAFDALVGRNMRRCRLLLGVSLQSLASATGITYQQLMKYEYGRDRIASSRMFEIARALNISVDDFFDGVANAAKQHRHVSNDGGLKCDPMLKRETLELVRAYYKISAPHVRQSLLNLAKGISEAVPISVPKRNHRVSR